MTHVLSVPLADITIPPTRRVLRSVDGLAASIAEVGLLNPITLSENRTLIAGLHRIEAFRKLERESIPAVVVPLTELQARLAELDENLERAELTPLERSEQKGERQRIFEAIHPAAPKSSGGRPPKNSALNAGFTKVESLRTGRSERAIQDDLHIATRIPEDVRDVIRPAAIANKHKELLALSTFDEGTQRQIAEVIKENPQVTLREALKEAAAKTPAMPSLPEKDQASLDMLRASAKWSKMMHDLWVQLNGIRDHGGIQRLSARWSDNGRQGYKEELDRMIELLTAIRRDIARSAA